jgi:hypothetical protein
MRMVLVVVAGFLVAGSSGSALAQEGRLPPPLQIKPQNVWTPQSSRPTPARRAPAATGSGISAPATSARQNLPAPAGEISAGPAPLYGPQPAGSILSGQVIPNNVLGRQITPVRLTPVRRGSKWRFRGNHLAKSVFVPNVLTGSGAGYFLRLPDGSLYALPASPDKIQRLSIRQEVRQLARVNRKRDRLRLRKAIRQARLQRPRRINDFYNDSSLQRGDVVVTSKGLQVFRGSATFPYNASHFSPLAAWRKEQGLSRRGGSLKAIERQLQRAPQR